MNDDSPILSLYFVLLLGITITGLYHVFTSGWPPPFIEIFPWVWMLVAHILWINAVQRANEIHDMVDGDNGA